jgi:DNA-binding PadR family transcriptional regulator
VARGTALEMAVLGLLHDAPMHGYELRKQVTGMLGWGRVLSYGTLYPCLKALVRSGYLAADTAAPADARRRTRITYSLTGSGRERFTALVTDVGPGAWDDENFGVHFAFFAHTDTRSRVRILEGRRSRLEERLEQVRSSLPRTRGGRTDPYTLELRRHGIESVAREVRWLTELIDAERARLAGARAPQSATGAAHAPAATASAPSVPTGTTRTPPPPPSPPAQRGETR